MARTHLVTSVRLGPRPLELHLATALMAWMSAASVLPHLRSGSANSNPRCAGATAPIWHATVRERAEALARDLAGVDQAALSAAVGREIRRRMDALERGVRGYRRHPYRRDLPAAPVIWQEGTTRLLDYGVFAGRKDGAPLLVVPSLINRAYILDLSLDRSLLRALAAAGFRPFLVDWDRPASAERGLDLTGYIAGRLAAALDRVVAEAKRPPAVIGYCMGGLLALALAQLRPHDVAALLLLATPWDFHAEKADLARATARATAPVLPLFERIGEMPVDVLQTLFAGLDPLLVARKFCAFGCLDPSTAKAAEFVALEDWLNDGVPLAAPVARECLLGWYGENTPGRGEWRVAGQAIRPAAIAAPTLVVVPEQDRIVPPASARALARQMPGADMLAPALGHIGMVASARAPADLWPALADWLGTRLATALRSGL
jgi:polyhydroxyalkanoate synthase